MSWTDCRFLGLGAGISPVADMVTGGRMIEKFVDEGFLICGFFAASSRKAAEVEVDARVGLARYADFVCSEDWTFLILALGVASSGPSSPPLDSALSCESDLLPACDARPLVSLPARVGVDTPNVETGVMANFRGLVYDEGEGIDDVFELLLGSFRGLLMMREARRSCRDVVVAAIALVFEGVARPLSIVKVSSSPVSQSRGGTDFVTAADEGARRYDWRREDFAEDEAVVLVLVLDASDTAPVAALPVELGASPVDLLRLLTTPLVTVVNREPLPVAFALVGLGGRVGGGPAPDEEIPDGATLDAPLLLPPEAEAEDKRPPASDSDRELLLKSLLGTGGDRARGPFGWGCGEAERQDGRGRVCLFGD